MVKAFLIVAFGVPLAVLAGQRSAADWQNLSLALIARAYAITAKDVDVAPPAGGRCSDCNGRGVVGDGIIETECLRCGGDGRIDDVDNVARLPANATDSIGDKSPTATAADCTGGG